MKKFKITRGDRVYIVDAKSHIDAINKVKSVKDTRFLTEDMEAGNAKGSVIRDYSPEVYVNELEKLIPEYIKLDKLRDKIIESLKSSGKIDSSNWRQTDKYINDAKVQQWLKQVKELDTKWNKLLDNLSRFKGTQSYRRDTNSSDKDIWLDDVPYPREIKGIQGDIAIIGLLKGSKKNKDSVSQWKPGMSEIGLFQISYKKGTVNQSILVKAATKEDAINKFTKHKPDAEVISVSEYPNPHFGEPILDSKMKDGGTYYGTLTIDLNSPDDLTAPKIVQALKNEIRNDKIAEIRGGAFTPVREYGSASLELDFKEFKYGDWGTNHIRLAVSYTVPAMEKALKNDPKYGAYKLRAELNNKLKQFANKTIYSNKSFTMDSKIKDIDEYKKNYASAMRAAGEKTKRDQINSDIQKLYDIAKQYGPIRTEQNKLNNEFEQQNMQVVRNRFYNDPTVKRALKQMEDLDTKWNAIVDKYKVLRQYSIPQDGPNRFMGWNTPTKKWVDDIKKQLIKDSAIKDSYGWSYIMAPMKTPGDKDLNLLSKLMSSYYDYIYQDVYNIRKAFAKTTDRRVAINMVKDTPKYEYFIKMLNMVDKDWNAVISKYPKLKKFNINTTGAERLLYGYYPTTKDFVDEITPVIKKEW